VGRYSITAQLDNREAQLDLEALLCAATVNEEFWDKSEEAAVARIVSALNSDGASTDRCAEFARCCSNRLDHASVAVKVKTMEVMTRCERDLHAERLGPELCRAVLGACGEQLKSFSVLASELGDKPKRKLLKDSAALLAVLAACAAPALEEHTDETPVGDESSMCRSISRRSLALESDCKEEMRDHLEQIGFRMSVSTVVHTLVENGYESVADIEQAAMDDLEKIGLKAPQLSKLKAWKDSKTTEGPMANKIEEGIPQFVSHSVAVVGSPSSADAAAVRARSAFASCRFNGEIERHVQELQAALKAKYHITLRLINMQGGGDIDKEVFSAIESSDTFIVFGSRT
jgi:hypothetical protein